ncbi:MAG: RluA family pseudouridine synthase [Alphaproteobacteria bacterium]|nr:RluA family pseudouridine synthase [Alphaproteobacteria bacterium]
MTNDKASKSDNAAAASVRTRLVSDDEAGTRLDRWLATAVPDQSRARLKVLIEDGCVELAGGTAVTQAALKVRPGQSFTVTIPAPEPATPEPERIPLTVVYEDDALIVIDKPAGMVVHPAVGNPRGTLVNALLEHCGDSLSGVGGVRRPGIVHRLDKDTSGLLVAAKSDVAHRDLVEQFSTRTISRIYRTVVWGVPKAASGTVEGNIGRSNRDRKKMAVLPKGGRTALTRYKVIEPFDDLAALLECRLGTGRTHQIRVHLAHLGHPVVGDPTYGRAPLSSLRHWPEALRAAESLGRQALHAATLGFRHPISGEDLSFSSPLPLELERLIATLRIKPI